MHLGYEFYVLTKIADTYHRHSDGKYRFSKSDYLIKVEEDQDLRFLSSLENLGIAIIKSDQFIINSNNWVDMFVSMINKVINESGYICSTNSDRSSLSFKKEKSEVSFEILFNASDFRPEKNQICFCSVFDYSYKLNWLELITDPLQLDFFIAYLNKSISKLLYQARYTLDLFEGLKEQYLGEIFRVTIPDYFNQSQHCFEKVTIDSDTMQEIRVLLAKDYKDIFGFKIHGEIVIFIYVDNRVEVFSFKNGLLSYSEELLNELNKLKLKLTNKISSYWKLTLMNEIKVHDTSRRAIQVITPILLVLNIVLFGSTFFSQFLTNPILLTVAGILLVILLGLVIFTIVIPTIKLILFEWRIKYYD